MPPVLYSIVQKLSMFEISWFKFSNGKGDIQGMGLESTFIIYQMHGASKIVANISMHF